MNLPDSDRPVLMAAYTHYRRDPRVRRQAEALVESGFRVVFLASRQPGEPEHETISGVEVVKLPTIGLQRSSMSSYVLDYALFFARLCAHLTLHPRRYALVHVNNMPDFLVFAAWLPRLLGVPVIHDVHDLMPELFQEKFHSDRHWLLGLLRFQERWAGRFATAVLTVEERLRDILSGRGISREKIRVLMNLPDDRIFAPRPGMPDKPPGAPLVIVYHGTLAHRLGLDIALQALAVLRRDVPGLPLQMRIIGAGEERSALVALRDDLGLGEMVTFSEGFVPVQSIPALLADADIGIVPLRISSGTDIMLPTKLLEYVTVGIACIVPRTGTISRYFDASMVEFFEAENVQALAAAIRRLATDPRRRRELVAEATRRFADTYRWSRHRDEYVGLVRALTTRRTPAG